MSISDLAYDIFLTKSNVVSTISGVHNLSLGVNVDTLSEDGRIPFVRPSIDSISITRWLDVFLGVFF